MPSSAPRLETARLILRPFRKDDLDDFASTMADPEIVRHLAIEPLSREDSLRRIFLAAGQWPIIGMGMWAVELKANGRMIGHLGFFDMERDMEPSLVGQPEMGWIFDRSVHGQGLAYEACMAALEWAEQEFGPVAIPAIISTENMPSMKLAERLGFVREPDGLYKGEAIAIFRRVAKG
ncbi:MAG: GNAT family N-acetyltransferase [Pseudomonadota bacterium]|nr:GNAT family N-acetyltransferase [Pseudomonadota bacterium]